VSADGALAVVADFGRAVLVHADGTGPIATITLAGYVGGIAFTSRGEPAIATQDGKIRLYDPRNGDMTREIVSEGASYALAFSDDDAHLWGGGTRSSLTQWEVGTGKVVREVAPGSEVTTLAVAESDGALLVGTVDPGHIELLVPGATAPTRIGILRSRIMRLALSRDGLAALVTEDGKIHVLSTTREESLAEINLWQESHDRAGAVAFAPDGLSFYVGTARGMVYRFAGGR
jgi:hypothetical protein